MKPPMEDGQLQFTLKGDWQMMLVDGEVREAGSQNVQRIVPLAMVQSWNYFDAGFVIDYKDRSREVIPWTSLLGILVVQPNSEDFVEAWNLWLDQEHNKHADEPGLRTDCIRCMQQAERDRAAEVGIILVDPRDNAVDHGEEES